MKTIRFISDNEKEKEFAKAVKKNVNQYFKENNISPKGNWKVIIQTISMLAIYIVPFILLFIFPMSVWWGLGAVVLMGIGMSGIG
ncbi:MAG: acyl-CoA desaturase, partial [Cyclobacteriaceae bacterium]|nr:acyl-CoA desaturase [Cyclobacteriaceae bacterium]